MSVQGDFLTSLLDRKPMVVQYATYTSVKWRLETISALKTDFREGGDILCQEILCFR